VRHAGASVDCTQNFELSQIDRFFAKNGQKLPVFVRRCHNLSEDVKICQSSGGASHAVGAKHPQPADFSSTKCRKLCKFI
jgi:hypothetical protein